MKDQAKMKPGTETVKAGKGSVRSTMDTPFGGKRRKTRRSVSRSMGRR